MRTFHDLLSAISAGPHRWRRGVSVAAGAGVLLLGGCGAPPALLTPGAREVTFQLWGPPGEPPMVIQAEQLTQVQAGSFNHLRFRAVSVRRPLENGVLVLTSPGGEYVRSDDRSLDLALTGPVHLSGSIAGDPMVGWADHAQLRRPPGSAGSAEVILDGTPPATDPATQAVMVMQGEVVRAARFVITAVEDHGARHMQVTTAGSPGTIGQELPNVAVVLAGLPRPLVLPPVLPREER